MISFEEAQQRIIALSDIPAIRRFETVDIRSAIGRVSVENFFAARSHPPFAASAMDGYAVRWTDIQSLPITLNVIGESHAGKRFAGNIDSQQAVRIFTGAPVPPGADTVVIQEDAELNGKTVTIKDRPAKNGGNIRVAGQDIQEGDMIYTAGQQIDVRRAALIASSDKSSLIVLKRPIVELVLCGDELKLPGETLGEDDIVSTNGMLLENLLQRAGAQVSGADRLVPDDLDILTKIISHSSADIIITCGGASVGERDYVQAALIAAGAKLDFWKIAMRPGKPVMVATLGTKIIIGLPGNPVSAFVCGILFGQPLVRAWCGVKAPLPVFEPMTWGAAMPANGNRADFVRVRLEYGKAYPCGAQDSAIVSGLAAADALALRPIKAPPALAGDPVQVLLVRDFIRT
jgi:molybdopterin molybdotransferase